MSTASEELLRSFEHLPVSEKRRVASEIIRRTFVIDPAVGLDEIELAALYAESSNEDRELAEMTIEDYGKALEREDT